MNEKTYDGFKLYFMDVSTALATPTLSVANDTQN